MRRLLPLLVILLTGCSLLQTIPQTILECRELGDRQLSEPCISALAFNKERLDLCEFLKTPSEITACQKNLLIKNPDLKCASDICIQNTASNLTECNSIRALPLKFECQAKFLLLEEGLKICTSQELSRHQYLCRASLAAQNKNTLPCQEIPDTEEERASRTHCYLRSAKALKDDTICKQITDNTDQTRCQIIIEVLNNVNPDCTKFDPPSQNECFQKIATETGQYQFCNRITDKINRNQCLSQTAELFDYFPEFCEQIKSTPSLYEYCLQATARNLNTCDQITEDNTLRAMCRALIKVQSKNY